MVTDNVKRVLGAGDEYDHFAKDEMKKAEDNAIGTQGQVRERVRTAYEGLQDFLESETTFAHDTAARDEKSFRSSERASDKSLKESKNTVEKEREAIVAALFDAVAAGKPLTHSIRADVELLEKLLRSAEINSKKLNRGELRRIADAEAQAARSRSSEERELRAAERDGNAQASAANL